MQFVAFGRLACFRVSGFMALMTGKRRRQTNDQLHLASTPTHTYGVGRHVAGGQVFDCWRDSGGNKVEHWADGDYVNDEYETSCHPMGSVPAKSWGLELSASILAQPTTSHST